VAKPKDKLNLLAIIGGVALMLVAWRFPVPLGFTTTTLLSLLAVVLGSLAGYKSGLAITIVYVFLYIVGLPGLLWYHAMANEPPLLATPTAGFVFGLPVAALVAGRLAPFGQGTIGRVFATAFAAHLAYLACGAGWMGYMTTPAQAWHEGLEPYLIPVILKSLVAGGVIVGLRKFVK
jgi:biotin transport system substrate-specific component